MQKLFLILFLCVSAIIINGQTNTLSSGGILSKDQAAYDVLSYDLRLELFPDQEKIAGENIVTFRSLNPMEKLVLDLDTVFTVEAVVSISSDGVEQQHVFKRNKGKLIIPLLGKMNPGSTNSIIVKYSGKPRSGGVGSFSKFIWTTTKDGQPWICVSSEGVGSDIWFPCKDHPSDEPETMTIRLTVPKDLVATSNGKLARVIKKKNKRTFIWKVSTPINNYCVTLNIAPYIEIKEDYESLSGKKLPFIFYALKENETDAKAIFPEFKQHFAHLESMLSPYPFQADKYGVAQVPYLGMEHQTIIAYGANFNNSAMGGIDWGFDALHQHELAHEWFGNVVTPKDFKDLWLNEAFACYSQILYAEEFFGDDKVKFLLNEYTKRVGNKKPLVSKINSTFADVYQLDIYYKGALMLHNLRYLIGDDQFFLLLKKWINPVASSEQDIPVCRFVDTKEFTDMAQEFSEVDLTYFFKRFLYESSLPELVVEKSDYELMLRWNNVPEDYEMPIEVKMGDETKVFEIGNEFESIKLWNKVEPEIDPNNWLLKK